MRNERDLLCKSSRNVFGDERLKGKKVQRFIGSKGNRLLDDWMIWMIGLLDDLDFWNAKFPFRRFEEKKI